VHRHEEQGPCVPTPGKFVGDVLFLIAAILEAAAILHLIAIHAGW
jgi:hypothetical protein